MFEQVFIADVEDVGGREKGDDHLGLEGAGGPDQGEGDDEGRGRGRGLLLGRLLNTKKYL